MHQIRVHLANKGLPILGDGLYGPGGRGAAAGSGPSRTLLHAAALRFRHPVEKGREVLVRSPLPEDFREALEALG